MGRRHFKQGIPTDPELGRRNGSQHSWSTSSRAGRCSEPLSRRDQRRRRRRWGRSAESYCGRRERTGWRSRRLPASTPIRVRSTRSLSAASSRPSPPSRTRTAGRSSLACTTRVASYLGSIGTSEHFGRKDLDGYEQFLRQLLNTALERRELGEDRDFVSGVGWTRGVRRAGSPVASRGLCQVRRRRGLLHSRREHDAPSQ